MPMPQGLLSLYGPGVPVTAAQLSHPWISGVSLRLRWCDIQPNPWMLDTSYLDTQLAIIRSFKLSWNFSVQSGEAAPDWLYRMAWPVNFRDASGTLQRMPCPWDMTAMSFWTWLVAQLGAKYGGDPLLSHVKTGGPLSSTTEEDMLLPGGPNGGSQLTSQFWNNYGANWNRLFGAEMTSADASAAAFPGQMLTFQGVASGLPGVDAIGEEAVSERMIQYFTQRYPGRTTVQNNGLSAFWNWKYLDTLGGQTVTGYQTLWSILNDPTWRMNGGVPGDPLNITKAAVNRAISAGAQYLEIYHADLVSPILAPVWQQLEAKWGPVT